MSAARPQLPAGDQKRAEQQSLRARLLTGQWAEDLERALNKHIREDRRNAWGIAEMSRNPFRSLSSQVGGVLYREPPTVHAPTPAGAELVKLVEAAGLWQLMQRVSTDLIGQREALVRVEWTERGGLLYRPVPCELCHVEGVAEAPDQPALVEEIQQRVRPDTKETVWCWEVLDVRDLADPIQRILSADRKDDLTALFLDGDKSGANYQYRDATGRPFLPIVMYHAERTGQLWDSFFGVEAVLGTFTVAVLLTFWVHGVKDGSFVTVYLVGGRVTGLEIESPGGTRQQVISAEPGSVIEVGQSDEGVQPSVYQVQPGFDPEKLMTAIGMFESGLAEYAGVSVSDLVRTGADPRSGISLSISREGLRAAQAHAVPQLRRGDAELVAVTAKVLNRATSTSYPESGYAPTYPSLPLSSAEVQALREDILAKVAAGLESKVDGYIRLHPGTSREQAMLDLQRIAVENAMFPGPAVARPFPGA